MTQSISPPSHYFKFTMGWQWVKAIIIQWFLNRLCEINGRSWSISLGKEVYTPDYSNCHLSSRLSTGPELGKDMAKETLFCLVPCPLSTLHSCHAVVWELILKVLAEAWSLDKHKALFQTITNNILRGLLSIPCSDKLMLYLIVLLVQINEITYGNRYSCGEYNEKWSPL